MRARVAVAVVGVLVAVGAAFLFRALRGGDDAAPTSAVLDTVDVRINEFAFAPAGEEAEWIELHNAGPTVDTGGMTITNRSQTKITELPSVSMPEGSFLVVKLADGVD